MKFYVDPEVCIGCGLCAETESEVFKMDDDGKAVAYQESTNSNEESAKDAMNSCPVDAISDV
ncbi:ferredoxin [Lachnotalea glycerini]|uniref:Ferredoxin n=1 Tax=Lachnotalea glycerini TaxID=1763509 RepID=A0A371J2G8_9FIRM|nr:ferredoxin [Lachnotalea glycerini]RDY26970.1 ferredoxin [Lachnotalea glycerini]